VKSSRRCLLLPIFILALSCSDVCRGQSSSAVRRSNDDYTVPFDLRHDFLVVVEGRIGPLEHRKFILDTGASTTLVSHAIASQLSLRRQKGTVVNYQRNVPIEWAIFPEVQIGPILATNMRLMVADLTRFSDFAQDVDAVVGLDLLSKFQSIQIAYQARTIRFRVYGNSLRVTLPRANSFLVSVQVQNRWVRLLLDTGLQGVLLYEERLRNRLPDLEQTNRTQVRIGPLSGHRVFLPGLRIGSEETKIPVYLIAGRTDAVPADIDGYLGPRALNTQWVELDFDHMVMRWQ
jgi:predicted aspartyl protease